MAEPQFSSVFAREMAEQNDEVWSPDGRISARIVDGGIRNIAFKPDMYQRYGDAELAGQLGQLARLGFLARTRARRTALKHALGRDTEIKHRNPDSQAEQRLREERSRLEIRRDSSNFRLLVCGGTTWYLQIKPGTVKTLSEEQFLHELGWLVKGAIDLWRLKAKALRKEILGPSFILSGLRNSKR